MRTINIFTTLTVVTLFHFSHSLTYTYPVKSVNLDAAPIASSYDVFNNPAQSQLIDPIAVHGITASDGSYIIVGKSSSESSESKPVENENPKDESNEENSEGGRRGKDDDSDSDSSDDEGPVDNAFAMRFAPSGQLLWVWASSSGGDVANAVVEIPGGLLVVAGYKTVGNVAKRCLTTLNLAFGFEEATTTNFGDNRSSHGAFEMVSIGDNDNVLLSGVYRKPNANNMLFKSYGNVSNGKAFVASIPINQIISGNVEWTTELSGYYTAKSAQILPNGNIAALLYGNGSGKQAAVALLNANGVKLWETTNSQHGEGTDITISHDGNSIIMTGQGGNGYQSGKLTKINASNGASVWTKEFTVGGNPNLIFNECWGVLALPDGFVASCGAGIEDGRCLQVSFQDRQDCLVGLGDPRPGAYLRKEGNFQNFVFKTDLNGELIWQRVDSYRCPTCPSMDDFFFNSIATTSSTAQYVIKGNNDGELIVVAKEGIDAVGILTLTGDGIVGPTSAPFPTPSPTSFPTNGVILGCADSPLDFKAGSNSAGCTFIADNLDFCSYGGIRSHCPVTCSACAEYACKDSELDFVGGGNASFNCDDIAGLGLGDRADICEIEAASSTCASTCEVC